MDVRLLEVIERGSPAQVALAMQMLAQPHEPDDVEALFNAYLHDPYLTRNQT